MVNAKKIITTKRRADMLIIKNGKAIGALHAGEIEKNNIIRYNGTIDMDVIIKETIKEW